MVRDIFQEVVQLLSAGESLVIATIFDKSGSAPRTAGAKMLVKADGSISGTIGGGKMEGVARELAREIFQSKKSVIQTFDLTAADAANMGMVCGGRGQYLLEYVAAEDQENINLYRAAAAAIANREKAWIITSIGTGQGNEGIKQQCLVSKDGQLVGRFQGEKEFLAKLISGPAKISIHAEVLEDQKILVEPIRTMGTLYIFGAGHVSQKLAPVAEGVGFQSIVLDDRPEYANQERFPNAEIILLPSLEETLPELPLDQDSYLVIVTRGHLHDKTILGQVLRKEAAYIGMIGSRAKRAQIYKALAEEWGYNDNDFQRVHSPIGLSIGAETPEEIAISIVAELIKVRAELENVPK